MVSTILFLIPVFRELYEIAPLIFGLAGVAVFGILAWNYGPGVIILHAIMILLSGLLALIIWHAGERAAIGDSSPSRETVLAVAARHGEANSATEYRGRNETPNSASQTHIGNVKLVSGILGGQALLSMPGRDGTPAATRLERISARHHRGDRSA